MKFAPIVPLQYLDEMAAVSNYHLCLAHLVTERKYKEFYRDRREKGDFIILDNGAYEFGMSIPHESLLSALFRVDGASILVVPDISNGEGNNYQEFKKFMKQYGRLIFHMYPDIQLMAVPHSDEDVLSMGTDTRISMIGLTKNWDERVKLGEEIVRLYGKKVHFLGIERDPIKEVTQMMTSEYSHGFSGVDSSLPYRLLSRGSQLDEVRPFPSNIDFFQKNLDPVIVNYCSKEIKRFCELVGRNSGAS